MNWLIVTIGMTIVLLLGAALVGPVFVDWNAYRAELEGAAERLLGTDVAIDGDARVRLLPTPTVTLQNVTVGDPAGASLAADELTARLGIPPMFSGEIRVLDLALDAPVATVAVGPDGTVALPALDIDEAVAGFAGDDVRIDSIVVTNGRIVIEDARTGDATTLEAIDATGDLRGARGPFNASGTLVFGGERQSVRLSAGSLTADGTMAASARVTPEGEAYLLALDGVFAPDRRVPVFTGTLALTTDGVAVNGDVTLSHERAELRGGTVVLGEDEGAVELGLYAAKDIVSDEPAAIQLAAVQIDLDRVARAILGREADATVPPSEALPALASVLSAALASPRTPRTDVLVEAGFTTVALGGAVLRDVAAVVSIEDGRIRLEEGEAALPGRTDLAMTGRVDDGFDGRVRLMATQPGILARWWAGRAMEALPLGPILVDGPVVLSDEGVRSNGFSVRMGQSSATGSILWSDPPDASPTLEVALSAPFLDAADVVGLASLVEGVGALPRRTVIDVGVDRIAVGPVGGRSLTIDAAYGDGALVIDALVADDIAGASLFMRGEIADLAGAPAGAITGELTLNDGAALAEAITGLFPANRSAARFAVVAPTLAPGRLDVTVSGRPTERDPDLTAAVSGDLGGTDVRLAASGAPLRTAGTDASLSLALRSQDAAQLLTQLGVAPPDMAAEGPLSVTLELGGPTVDALAGSLTVEGLGTRALYEGEVRRADGAVLLDGPLSLDVEELSRLAGAFGLTPGIAGPASLRAVLAPTDDAVALHDLSGTVAGVAIDGDLTVDGGRIGGSLAIAEADLRTLVAAILGREATTSGDGLPTTVFSSPDLSGIEVDLALSTPRLGLGDLTLADTAFDLALTEDALAISGARGVLAGGRADGALTITRDGARADLSGTFTLSGANLADLVWRVGDAPVARGELDLSVDLTSEGFTLAGLVGNLAGSGTVTATNGSLVRLNPAPFDLMTTALDADDLPSEDAVRAALATHLDAAGLPFERIAAVLSVADGIVRLGDVSIVADSAARFSEAAIDLASWQLTSAFDLDLPVSDGTAPSVTLALEGPLGDPLRRLDVSALMAWLNLKSLERQVEAVEEENEALAAEADALDEAVSDPVAPTAPEGDAAPQQESDARPVLRDRIGELVRSAQRSATFGPPLPTTEREGSSADGEARDRDLEVTPTR